MILFADTEVRSTVDISHGAHRYAEEAEVLLFTYAIDDGEAKCWDLTTGAPMPADLAQALADPSCTYVFHNMGFDRTVLREALDIDLPIERCHCTAAQAYAHALPGSLANLGAALGLPADKLKDKRGYELIKLFCIPQKYKGEVKRDKPFRGDPRSHPVEWAEFVAYATQDIVAMRAVYKRLPVWNYRGVEHRLWQLDQTINDRGIQMDVELAEAAVAAVDAEILRLGDKVNETTEGVVKRATQRDALLAYMLFHHNVHLPDLKAATVEKALDDDSTPGQIKTLLQDRLDASTSSTAKYTKIIDCTGPDGRIRGTMQFAGAGRTRRWAGRLIQPQNFPRPVLGQAEIDTGIEALKLGCADLVAPNVMQLASSALRGVIVAPPSKKLVVADLANIEGRVAAWLAGEEWKLDAFRAYDAGKGPDLYKVAYGRAFNVDPSTVDKNQRQIGKVQELFLQYQGGVGAFVTGAGTYGIDLEHLGEAVYQQLADDVLAECYRYYNRVVKRGKQTYGLSEQAFVSCDGLKRLWRRAHPLINNLWPELEQTCMAAIRMPGETLTCYCFKVRVDGAWLRILLPSGNYLVYPSPALFPQPKEEEEEEEEDEDKEDHEERPALSFAGQNNATRQWQRIYTYGGKLFENATQGLARDVLAHGMLLAESSGYEIVASVHDELITETPEDASFSAEGLASLMSIVPAWAVGMPLAAEGFEAARYRK